jgi:hypothetical protein
MMKLAIVIVLGLTASGCVSSARFAPAPPQVQAAPQQPPSRAPSGGPFERQPDEAQSHSPAVRP